MDELGIAEMDKMNFTEEEKAFLRELLDSGEYWEDVLTATEKILEAWPE